MMLLGRTGGHYCMLGKRLENLAGRGMDGSGGSRSVRIGWSSAGTMGPVVLVYHADGGGHPSGEYRGRFVTLPDPCTGEGAAYLLRDAQEREDGEEEGAQGDTRVSSSSGCHLQEVQWHKQRYGAWFVGDTVIEDGSMYLASLVDPLFIVLPVLEKSLSDGQDTPFMDAESVCETSRMGETYPDLFEVCGQSSSAWGAVCDVKVAGGDQFFRFNPDRALAWLHIKVSSVREALLGTKDTLYENMEPKALDAFAVGIVSEYLSAEWMAKVAQKFGVSVEDAKGAPAKVEAFVQSHAAPTHDGQPFAKDGGRQGPAKKAKVAGDGLTAKQRELKKGAKGTKSLMGFFSAGSGGGATKS